MKKHYYKCLSEKRYQLGKYKLESVQLGHIEKIRQWRNEQMDILRQSNPISKSEQINYYNNNIWPDLNSEKPKNILLSYKVNNQLVGYGGLVHISWQNLRGEISFLLKTDIANTPKDYDECLPNFLRLIKQIAFNELSLNRIYGELYDLRPKYSLAFENSGFILDGNLKEQNIINGVAVDSLVYGLVNNGEFSYADFNKNNLNVLITSISKKIPMIKSVLKAVSKVNSYIKVYGGDSNSLSIGKFFVDEFWVMPKLKRLRPEKLINFCKNNNIGLIIPSRDGELEYFSTIKKQLEKVGISVMVSDKKNILSCLDKLQFSKLEGIKSVFSSENIEDIAGKRFVVKERYGAGSNSIGINFDKNNAIAHSKKLKNPIYQPFIDGYEISADAFICIDGTIKGMVMRRREIVINGESQLTSTFRDEKLEKELKQSLTLLQLYGHVILQAIISDKNEIFIIECNPRFGGASTVSINAGLDSFYWLYLESMKVSINDYPFSRSEKEITQLRYPKDSYL